MKQEARWFQQREAKRQRKRAKKLAEQRKKECLAKENEEQRKKNELLEQLLKEKLGRNLEVLLSEKLGRPSPFTPVLVLQGVQTMAVPAGGKSFLPHTAQFQRIHYSPRHLDGTELSLSRG